MTVTLTPEREKQLLAEHHAKQAQRESEDAEIQRQRDQIKANWESKKNPAAYPSGSTHPCEVCKGTIGKGDLIRKRVVIVNTSKFGYDPQPRTMYRHERCPEAKTL